MDAKRRSALTLEYIVKILVASAQPTGMLLAIDDAQHLDSKSWTLVKLLSSQAPEILLVILMRPVQAPSAPGVSGPAVAAAAASAGSTFRSQMQLLAAPRAPGSKQGRTDRRGKAFASDEGISLPDTYA